MVRGGLPYENPSLSTEQRVADLLGRLSLEEKAGLLFHTPLQPGPGGSLSGPASKAGIPDTVELLKDKHLSHFNLLGPVTNARLAATWYNHLQQYVLENTRFGIPVTLSSDPRHHFSSNIGTGFVAGALSQWPEPWGFGALQDPELVRKFGDVVRQEYGALGLRVALHPQADIATEYRWARSGSTFGEGAEKVAELVAAYIRGLQGDDLTTGVSTVTKHFPGSGPQQDGEDSHFVYGKSMVWPGGRFEDHLQPFRSAITAGTRQIMPAYGKPTGSEFESVGMGFNRDIITGVLRNRLGFDGIVLTDWGLITDAVILGQDMPARAWGVEHLSELERLVKIFDAGCDQFGGEYCPELVIEAVRQGLVTESRLDNSVRRVLAEKFLLGLFDERRFVDVDAAAKIVGSPDFVALGETVQRQAFTVLLNGHGVLPLQLEETVEKNKKFYIEGLSEEAAQKRGLQLVSKPGDADVALLRLRAPYEPRPGGFESLFHAGSLEFAAGEAQRLAQLIEQVPTTLVDVYLDRPAVLTPLAEAVERVNGTKAKSTQSSALLVNFGGGDEAFLDVVFGVGNRSHLAEGRLPFDLPRSQEAVNRSREDVAFDTERPLFTHGTGLGL